MNQKVNSIVQIFPDFEEKIDFLFQTDENFRDLCADHIMCASMVLELKKEQKMNSGKIEEYEDIQQSLEQEILKMITNGKKAGDGNNQLSANIKKTKKQ